jgi:alpha-L-rhamnosidase
MLAMFAAHFGAPFVAHAAGPLADGWIMHPDSVPPVVLQFRRELVTDRVPESVPVTVTADNRFVLYVNGRRVASGPSTGTVRSWRYSQLDLAPYLRPGSNVVSATVWDFGDLAPAAQQRVATGLRVTGDPLSTTQGWQVRVDRTRSAVSGREHIPWTYYVASTPEVIDPARDAGDEAWRAAVPAPAAAARGLVPDELPAQEYSPADPGRVVRSSLAGAERFPSAAIVVPAHATVKLLLRREAMISAYPELEVSGGRGARVEMHYGEALYDAAGQKGDRDLVDDRQLRGFHDLFLPDGRRQVFAPLWWRTFRFIELVVRTEDVPLTLQALRLYETGYPFQRIGSFESDDAELNRIWQIGWRTLRVDAHETFMDSSFWEQLQYAGDTRLQMLISYAVGGDPRLARQAIDAFAESDVQGGLMQGAYPSRLDNVIATFSLAWVGMLHDWWLEQSDSSLVRGHLPRMRRVLAWFEPYVGTHGLLGRSPHWNFIDWAGQAWDDRERFPSWGRGNGSCLMTAMWLGALRQGAALEKRLGDATEARRWRRLGDRARAAIRDHCWNPARGLYADDVDGAVFSQHMNVFAVLYDVADASERAAILERITVPGRGIDAPAGMYASTYYFAWYLARAYERAGWGHRYHELLQSWRELLPMNYTTWPESRGQPRSDTHAWSAHPTADLLGVVAGIRPSSPGYGRVRIAPQLGHLTWLRATAATPHGPVRVAYHVQDGRLLAEIERPAPLPGEFVWNGRTHRLTNTRTRLELAR